MFRILNMIFTSVLYVALLINISFASEPNSGDIVNPENHNDTTSSFQDTKSNEDKVLYFGDLGKPSDYNDTIANFDNIIPNYDAFIEKLPYSFNWDDLGKVTVAKNQSSCGSCYAFACVGVFESKLLISLDTEFDLSEQQIISCDTNQNGCVGGSMTALQYWYNIGPWNESCTGYPSYNGSVPSCSTFSGCQELPYNTNNRYTVDTSNINNIKTSIHTDGPAYFRFSVYSDFQSYWYSANSGDVYTQSDPNASYTGQGHAVLVIGWDDNKNAWLCKNSWGATAGPNGDGTFWFAYNGHIHDLNIGVANVELSFQGQDFTITATAGVGGNINPVGEITVPSGNDITFNIIPDLNYQISDVTVDGQSEGNISTYTFHNVQNDHTIGATFAPIGSFYTISATAGSGGNINPSGDIIVSEGSDATFNIIPNLGHQITDVEVDGQSEGPISTYTFYNVQNNHTINATFAPIGSFYTISATAGFGGNINPSGDISVSEGDDVTFNIEPNTGYQIADVQVDGQSEGPVSTYTFYNVQNNHTITAAFSLKIFSLYIDKYGDGDGSTNPSVGKHDYNYGTLVNIDVMPNNESIFAGWSGDDIQYIFGDKNNSIAVLIDTDKHVTAKFELKKGIIGNWIVKGKRYQGGAIADVEFPANIIEQNEGFFRGYFIDMPHYLCSETTPISGYIKDENVYITIEGYFIFEGKIVSSNLIYPGKQTQMGLDFPIIDFPGTVYNVEFSGKMWDVASDIFFDIKMIKIVE